MKVLGKLYDSFVAQIGKLYSTLLSLLKVILGARRLDELPASQKSECCILGNGPSLNYSLEHNMDFIKSCDIVCVNNFTLTTYFKTLKPENYILFDYYYFMFDGRTHNREDVRSSFEIFKTVDWTITLFIPHYAKKSYFVNTIVKNNPNLRVAYFNHVVVEGYNWFKFSIFKRSLGMPQCQNVMGAAIFNCINRKYNRIYLLGADHSWHENVLISETNAVKMYDEHFYDNKEQHNVLRTYPKTTVAAFFLSLYKAFRSYYVLNEYAEYQNVKIYNASQKSYIDAFEKVKL